MIRPATRRLRSRFVQTTLLGASAFALSACEEPVDLTFFESTEACHAAAAQPGSEFTAGDCDEAGLDALREHAVLAPRYESLALCEEEHGVAACATPEEAGGAVDQTYAGSSYMPFFMGYMLGNALSNRGGTAYAGRPVYSDTQGRSFSTDGQRLGFAGSGAKVAASPATLRSPAVSSIAAPMSRATVRASGGFGAARAASFGG